VLLIYGASGYTGALIARHAAEYGLKPILAGRDAAKLERVARPLGLDMRVAAIDDAGALGRALNGVSCVLNCAGPFSRTALPVFEACLPSRAHYLDITGEIGVFEALFARGEAARRAGVMALPGVGFDVVPSDCLAAHVVEQLPDATHLTLGIRSRGGISHGTASTMLEQLTESSLVREAGRLTPIALGSRQRDIDFGRGPRRAVAIAWGDVANAFYSTGVPNIEVYWSVPGWLGGALRAFGPSLVKGAHSPRVRRFLQSRIDARAPGPNDAERARGGCTLWAEARNAAGKRVSARLITPEGYELTVRAALHVARAVLAGRVEPGYQTPSTWAGPDWVLELPGVRREPATP